MRPQPRRTGTWSRSIGLPGKESRGPLQDLPLLAQHPILALELAQPLPLLARQHVLRSPRSASSWRSQFRNVCSGAAKLGRQLLRRPHPCPQHPHRLNPELRRVRRSRPRHHTRSSHGPLGPKASRCQPKRVNSIRVASKNGFRRPLWSQLRQTVWFQLVGGVVEALLAASVVWPSSG